ncbi:tetratricopeptide repeat protein [Litoreibacter ponti]|uniref:Tetratricopeptide repeat protein n=1 Tax=Litoreibacter ponti TaxID=1510457 RepID=A0A2T6BKN8_9RHOB|nr:tetratricopeptide repeat protein [Litoreibacter ponti]PTX56621.1 tetratricopeptide repeat protein [Litoreibacter ponti]
MKARTHILNLFVTSFLAFTAPAFADQAELDALFEELAQPELENWELVERKIWREWSRSGSPAMDLLLRRGRNAMRAGDLEKAIDHFTALTDHAPEFAEGWNARATAFFNAEEYGLSIADIGRTLSLNPRHFGALQGLGRILEELEQEDDALKAYQAAAAIHPHRDGIKEAIERLERKTSGQDI